ncbi:lamin tail domain-containing protein [Actinoplanes couchii]|uniref:LTD domain-containing protein n=1 Tax=Actinoplanes couchii TaxID=403638 RepID=A0ABQ3XG83_9ACTN|nr:lamin tail domain-containing protein [Actinoplanes couchii]MDR6320984.1 hypothetical protein [Actinoplanes couchii]GID57496.1 hypothetical protein Aco03nite_059000 [Actinoplanes couchii]
MSYVFVALVAGAVGVGGVAVPAVEPDLRFHVSQYDAPGVDKRTPESLGAEWISVINTGPTAISLKGWTVGESQGRVYTFGAVVVPAKGGKVRLRTGGGVDTAADVHWNSGTHVWDNTGDQAILRDPAGKTHDLCGWGYLAGRTRVKC